MAKSKFEMFSGHCFFIDQDVLFLSITMDDCAPHRTVVDDLEESFEYVNDFFFARNVRHQIEIKKDALY